MFRVVRYSGRKEEDEPIVLDQLESLLEGETDRIANLANAAALLAHYLEGVNWVGFYLWDEARRELVLGPFQGLPACVRIATGKGVCGTAAAERRTVNVPDVHAFPGHIACDAASASEIVLPLLKGDRLLGVLDLDSPRPARFAAADAAWLERFVALLVSRL